MKKITTILAAAALLFTSSAFASNGDNELSSAKASFQKDFGTVTNVTWETNSDFYFAHFTLNQASVTVAYNEAGEFIGSSREIAFDQLPLSASMSLASNYEGYTLDKTATEMNFNGETFYYINAENSKLSLKLKCSTNGEITVENKTKKK